MQTTQPNNLITLEWLVAPLNEQLNAIYDYSCTDESVNEYLLYISAEYQKICRVFSMANAAEFERLAKTVSFASEQVAIVSEQVETKDLAYSFLPVVIHTSKLLQYELNHLTKSGNVRKNLLDLRTHYLQLIMAQMNIDIHPENIWQAALDSKFSDQIEFDNLKATDTLLEGELDRLSNDWHALKNKLLDETQNTALILSGLRAIALRLSQVNSGILKKLWLLTLILIDTIASNKLREDDRYILLKLERAFSINANQDLPIFDVLWLENIFIDLYINLASLPKKDQQTQQLLNSIDDGVILEQTFFSYVLRSLQDVLKALDQDRIHFDILNKLYKRLSNRGWSFYAGELEEVIDYATGANISEESFDVIKIHLTQKIQSLIDTIEKTYQAIQKSGLDNELDADSTFSIISITLEEVKNSFTTYLESKDVADLPDNDSLEQLNYYFEQIKLTKAAKLSQHLGEMFATLAQKAPTRIGWQLAHDIADGLALFEMFLDSLTRQVFDDALLVKAQESIDASFAIIDEMEDKNDDVLELFDIYAKLLKSHENTILYDDNGEKVPVSGEIIHSYTIHDNIYADTDDIEDVIYTESAHTQSADNVKTPNQPDEKPTIASITTVPHFQIDYRPEIKTASTTMTNNPSKSHDILFTDILSLPSISLSDGEHNDNHLTQNAIKAMGIAQDLSFDNQSSTKTDAQKTDDSTSQIYQSIKSEIKADDFSFDAEFREIFVEEADEVIDEIHVHLATLHKKGFEDLATIKEIRRGYHTLKGSGRMVGAYGVGETAWSIENMLNRVLDRSIKPTQELIGLVLDTTEVMPMMVQDFAAGKPSSVDNVAIIIQAQNLIKGRPLKEGLPDNDKPLIPQVEDFTEELSKDSPQKLDHNLSTDTIDQSAIDNHSIEITPIWVDEPQDNAVSDHLADLDEVSASKDLSQTSQITEDTPSNQDIETQNNDNAAKVSDATLDDEVVFDDLDTSDEDVPSVLLPFLQEAKQPLVFTLGEIDDDIKEIFIEEAHEVLDDIIPMFKSYLSDRSQEKLLIDVRRGFHTLKGSGRMVGAMELGELAWAVENMMNRVLDKSITLNEGMCTVIHEILDAFLGLIDIFKNQEDQYPEKMLLWRAVCHAYSKGLADKFDYRMLANPAYKVADWQVDDGFEKPEVAELRSKSSLQALNSLQQAGEIIQKAEPSMAQSEEEEMLCGIFVEEGKELLGDVKAFLEKNKNAISVPVNDKVVRVFHTLRGASGLPPLTGVGEVGAIIERVLQDLQQHETPMTQTHLSALHEAVVLIEAHLDAYENPDKGSLSSHQQMEEDKQFLQTLLPKEDSQELGVAELIEGIDTLIDAETDLVSSIATNSDIIVYANQQLIEIDLLSSRTKDRRKFQRVLAALKEAYQLAKDYPFCMQDEEFVVQLLDTHHQLIGLFDSLAGSMSLHLEEEGLQALADSVVKHTVDYHRQEHLKEAAQLEQKEMSDLNELDQSDEMVDFEHIYTDDELLQIFLDEALSLDKIMTTTVKDWHQNPKNTQYIQSLSRYVHTIQGGARLAGIVSVGDLAGEIEAVFQKLLDKKIIASFGWVTVIGQLMDVLSLQLEMIKSKKQSFFADRTIGELHHYLSMIVVPDEAAVFVPIIEITDEQIEDEFAQQAEVSTDLSLDSQPVAVVDVKKLIEDSWQGNVPDMDILEVFLEEAKDLAESSSEEFGVFRNNTTDSETLHSLQRKLHTIKGGARMVSANGMADLAHEMETIYEDLGNGRRPATPMVTQLLYACHDWISTAVGLLEQQYNPPRPTPLIEALHQFIQDPQSLTHIPQVSLEKDLEALTAKPDVAADTQETDTAVYSIEQMPPMKGVFGEQIESATAAEMIRISAPLMEEMINLSGEAAINRARVEMNMVSLTSNIEEMGATAQRLSDQLRRMDIELEAQIIAQLDEQGLDAGFDPLEMDQYSSLNQLSKSLSESASDLLDIKSTLLEKTRDSENLLLQLSRTQARLQDSLMNSRMVPFSRLTPRLQRIVRQTAGELGKSVELTVINADDEMDRNILDRITSPLEHMLRNAVDHGIEYPDYRSEIGKSATGQIILEVQREGNEVVILLSDDGAGVDVEAVRKKAISQGLIRPDERLSDNDIMQYIFNAGLSTTNKVTQISGRGVGMDVVRAQVRELGGTVAIESERAKGSKFIIRVPLTVAMSDTLIVRVSDRQYAIPLIQIDRVVQVDVQELKTYYRWNKDALMIEDKPYRVRYLDEILSNNDFSEDSESSLPVIIIKNRVGQQLALQVDEIVGSRTEVVVKPLGRQLSHLSGISAATIMGDGSVMLILDLLALMRVSRQRPDMSKKVIKTSHRDLIMVVDDSVTVRKVTSRFLERHGFDVVVAKDGVDAVEKLQDTLPDLMLLDIEMPRMDGFEVATQVRNSERLKNLPIIMITSRTGEKHRERALDIGVNDYMGKPFQEADLLTRIYHILDLQDDAD